MAVRIRLQRHGRKKRPFYRLVAADARSQRDGRFIERLGHYNPLTDTAEIFINEEKALKWLRSGAQASDTAKSLLTKVGIWAKFVDEKQGRSTPGPVAEPSALETVSAHEAKEENIEPETTQEEEN